jgi:hypothetical protein
LTRQLERAFSAANRQANTAAVAAAPAVSDAAAAVAVAKAAAAKAAWYNQRRTYRQLRHRKCAAFWRDRIETDQSDPQKFWRSVDVLPGCGRVPSSSSIDVESFMQFFTEKVAKVRKRTSDATPPVFSHVRSGVSLRQFSSLTTDDVINAVRRLPDKSSATDPIPTSVFKQIADLVAPFIVELFNRSLAAGHFPAGFKEAFITPLVKRPGLDATDVNSYRPISNLPVISKLLERLVVRQLMEYLTSAASCHHCSLDSGRDIRLRLPCFACCRIFCKPSIAEMLPR